MCCGKLVRIYFSLFSLLVLTLPTKALFAQGNISGSVSNSDTSTPANGEISFYGYLDNTDEEIRIEGCVGAGYDNGNWFDDFQNYLTEAFGDPFNFHFYNSANGEGYVLSSIIEVSSFQQEDIILSSVNWPEKPTGLTGKAISGPAVEIDWTAVSGLTYHIYRRDASSNGSFFRIDDPAGFLSNPGVISVPYIDNTVDGTSLYDYLIIAENLSGDLGQHSDFITQSSNSFLCGDVDNNGEINVLDLVYFINFKYKGGPEPDYIESAEVNGDGDINVLDLVYLINFKYKGGPDLLCPEP